MLYPIITSYEEMLHYLGRFDYLIPPDSGAPEESAPHLGNEAGDTGFSAEPILGNSNT